MKCNPSDESKLKRSRGLRHKKRFYDDSDNGNTSNDENEAPKRSRFNSSAELTDNENGDDPAVAEISNITEKNYVGFTKFKFKYHFEI